MMDSSSNLVWHDGLVLRADRERLYGRRSIILWFTGLSGAGKSTLARAVEQRLYELRASSYVLDGDNVRHGLCSDLGFSESDRSENIRRIGEVAKLFLDAGIIILAAFISPYKRDRERVRSLVAKDDFLEIHCSCSVAVCEARDVKGLYKRARSGVVKDFTGVSSPYEEPVEAELVIDTGTLSLDSSVELVLQLLRTRGIL
ncbi:adenylyl-sulfate kinase [Undibacterium sp. TJN25]|uniref:adenylyl-sulfate kinase n=1 Tax=Undibacterium sp. TJN25 TaxID=3413056 RepID=UPI003BF2C311